MSVIAFKTINAEKLKNKYRQDALKEHQESLNEYKKDLRENYKSIFVCLLLGLILGTVFITVLINLINKLNCGGGIDVYINKFLIWEIIISAVVLAVTPILSLCFFSCCYYSVFKYSDYRKFCQQWIQSYANDFERYLKEEYSKNHRYRTLLYRLFTENNDYKLLKIRLLPNDKNENKPYLMFDYEKYPYLKFNDEEYSYVESYKQKFNFMKNQYISSVVVDLVKKTIIVPYDFDLDTIYSSNFDVNSIVVNQEQDKMKLKNLKSSIRKEIIMKQLFTINFEKDYVFTNREDPVYTKLDLQ